MNIFEKVEDQMMYPYSEEDRAGLYVQLSVSSEGPTSPVLRGDSDYTPRKMPSNVVIAQHWAETLVRLNKFDSLWEVGDYDLTICWACGLSRNETLDRAHILPRWRGGSDSASNLHLLCYFCHLASENLYGVKYWEFFRDMNSFVKFTLLKDLLKKEGII